MSGAKSPDFTSHKPILIGIICFALCTTYCSFAFTGEFRDFENAQNAYNAGEYQTAVDRFEAILSSEISNQALLQDTHKLLAVSYLFVGDREKAEAHFTALLTLQPDFNIDPLAYPIDVIDFFTDVKNRYAEQLRALRTEKLAEKAARKKAEEEKRRRTLEKLRHNVYISRDRKEHSKLLALMPFGLGQFQNNHKIKGAIFMSAEILLTAAATTTFILHEGLRPRGKKPFKSTDERHKYERLEIGYRVANQASLISLGTIAILGIIDSLYYFKSESITWEKINENSVPKHLRPNNLAASITPAVTGNAIGISFGGIF